MQPSAPTYAYEGLSQCRTCSPVQDANHVGRVTWPGQAGHALPAHRNTETPICCPVRTAEPRLLRATTYEPRLP